MNNIVVYTAIYGDKDELAIPKLKGCDFVYFTGEGGRMEAKKPKILPHRYFREYEYSMWIDGNIKVFGDIKSVVEGYMKDYNLVMLTHPAKSIGIIPTIFNEFKICIDQKLDKPDILKKQMKDYKKQGCPDGEISAGGIIIRKHNDKEIFNFCESWWQELNKHSGRDQLSFLYLAWKMKLKYGKLNNIGLGANWFRYCGHKI